MSYQDKLKELEKLRENHHKGATKAIERLVEPDSFVETDAFYGEDTPGEGLVTGNAVIGDRQVYIYAHEHDVLGGSFSKRQADKLCRLLEDALKTGTPVIGMIHSNGTRINDGLDAADGYGRIIKAASKASGIIPHLIIAEGAVLGAMAVFTQCADAVVAVKDTTICVSPATKTMVKISDAQHTAVYIAETPEDSADYVRSLLHYLPDNNTSGNNELLNSDDPNRVCSCLNELAEGHCDPKEVLTQIADNGRYIELYGGYAPELVTAFTSVSGQSLGVLANRYSVNNGRITAGASKKGARFIQLCNSLSIPLLFLTDTDGFELSKKAEEEGLASDAAKFAAAVASASVPMITVILKRAIGSGYVVMGSLGLGADRVYAWAGAQIGLMVPSSAVSFYSDKLLRNVDDPVKEREKIEEAYALEYMDALLAAKAGYISEPIEPAYTRMYILSALDAFYGKREPQPLKKNAVLPL